MAPPPHVTSAATLLCHFSHGFASNCLTWAPFITAHLAPALHRRTDAGGAGCEATLLMVAHDRPGFGLTSRPLTVEGYSEAAGARLALALVRRLVRRLLLPPRVCWSDVATGGAATVSAAVEDDATAADAPGESPHARSRYPTQRPPRVLLVGHSLGCAQAVRMALRLHAQGSRGPQGTAEEGQPQGTPQGTPRACQQSDDVAALILLAPALMPCPRRALPAALSEGLAATLKRTPRLRRVYSQYSRGEGWLAALCRWVRAAWGLCREGRLQRRHAAPTPPAAAAAVTAASAPPAAAPSAAAPSFATSVILR